MPPEERINPKTTGMEGLSFGNYLAFAIANRWVRQLTFVLHPEWENDLPFSLFKDFSDRSNAIQLKLYNRDDVNVDKIRRAKPIAVEPEVPLQLVKGSEFQSYEPFSYVVLCQSPGYTPASADKLLEVILEYIAPI